MILEQLNKSPETIGHLTMLLLYIDGIYDFTPTEFKMVATVK